MARFVGVYTPNDRDGAFFALSLVRMVVVVMLNYTEMLNRIWCDC